MASTRSFVACLVLLLGCGAEDDPLAGLTIVGEDPSDSPIEGIDDRWMDRFLAGDALFEQVFLESQGLGPLYIRHSCASCHADDGRGPGTVRKMVLLDASGAPAADQSALEWGHTERPQLTSGATTPIAPPDGADVLESVRFGPPTFARGYMEAVRADEIERIEAEQAARDDGISGRINRVPWSSSANPDQPFHAYGPGDTGLVGRFGVKARIPTVDEFVADAYQGDMGITSPLRAEELPNPDGLADDVLDGTDIDLDTINLVGDYVRLLALPRRPETDGRGEELFASVGCATCHVPSLRTRDDYPVPQLAGIDAPVYTDFLLHDMGAELADGMVEHDATGREWRTAPLIGLRFLRRYMHDGRAATVEDAIEMHAGEGSEANGVLDAFVALSDEDRSALVSFTESL